jgi:uncharacterized phage protein gp47/JayE
MAVYVPKDFEAIFEDMKNYILAHPESNLTDFRPGSSISIFLGSVAEQLEELHGQTTLGWRSVIEWAIFSMYTVMQRKEATFASGNVIFFKDPTFPSVTVPVGTMVSSGQADYETTLEIQINTDFSQPVPIIATTSGVGGNSTSGTITILTTPLDGVISVNNTDPVSGGSDAETIDDFKYRFSEWAKSLGRSNIHTIRGYVGTVDGVHSSHIMENFPEKGDVTIYVEDGSGSATSDLLATVKDALEGDLIMDGGIKPAGIQYLYTTPTIISITVNIELTFLSGFSPADVTANVLQIITDLINSKNIGDAYVYSEMVYTAQSVDGVASVPVLTPRHDISITTDQIIRAGSITVGSYQGA